MSFEISREKRFGPQQMTETKLDSLTKTINGCGLSFRSLGSINANALVLTFAMIKSIQHCDFVYKHKKCRQYRMILIDLEI